MGNVYVIGTFDTKAAELRYVRDRAAAAGAATLAVDVSTGVSSNDAGSSDADVPPARVAAHHPEGGGGVFTNDRGTAVAGMARALTEFIADRHAAGDIDGVLGLGGSGGTAVITPALRALPVGIPKLMVSTVASGDVAPYVGPSDIAMLHAVTDVAGLNRISRQVLGNAAHGIAGMALTPVPPGPAASAALGLTMFGVTTPCVTAVREQLSAEYDCLVFHATGTGGRSMEKLVDDGLLTAVVDISTTEVCELRFTP